MQRPVRCARCASQHDARLWSELELVDELSGETVRACVTSWPTDARIEVRRCPCGQPLARTERA